MIPTTRVARRAPGPIGMETARRENYDSGEDFVLEYGELRFTFNEADFSERCEQAALKLGFVGGRLGEEELEDLVNLAVNGEILDPASALGEHVNDCWPELVGPAERSLVHWLRRLVFRGAWLDQRVKEGELGVASTSRPAASPTCSRRAGLAARRADRAGARALLGPGRLPPNASQPPPRAAAARALVIAAAPSSPTSSSGLSVPLASRSRIGWRPVEVSAASSAITVVSPPSGRSAVAITVSEPPSRRLRAAASALRAAWRVQPVEAVDQHQRVAAAGGHALGGVDRALDRLALRVGGGGEA